MNYLGIDSPSNSYDHKIDWIHSELQSIAKELS